MKNLLLLITFMTTILTSLSSFSTEQKINSLIYNGQQYYFNFNLSYKDSPIEESKALEILSHVNFSTANWSSDPYVLFEIVDKKLFVKDVYLDLERQLLAPKGTSLKKPK
jgi:hypothetical protein